MTLNGKRIVVLGGSSGIGLATARAAAQEGANVVIASSRKERIDEALATLPTGTEGRVVDLADSDAAGAVRSAGRFRSFGLHRRRNAAARQFGDDRR